VPVVIINEKIRFLRQSRGWSQEDMAARLQMSANGYGSVERGETELCWGRLEKIAKVFDMSVVELVALGVLGERNNNHQNGDNNSNYQYWLGGADHKELRHQLEIRATLLAEREREVVQLKEMIELMKLVLTK
jgi:transcriptional regulator with XRE-family HTH domain